MNILVVDDMPEYRMQAAEVLESLSVNVVTAIDGMDAWEKLNRQKFSMIISDWQMPHMDGLELLAKVKGSEHADCIFILLTTAPNAEEVRRAEQKYKPDAVLGKPAAQHVGLFETYIKAVN